MRAGLLILSVVLIGALETAALGEISFIYPTANSWVDKQGHLVLRTNSAEATALRITVNDVASDRIDVGSPEYRKLFMDFFIALTMWDEGRNQVTVDLFKEGQKLETATTLIYYLPVGQKREPPPEYVPNTLHVAATEKLCVPCHNMKPTQKQMNSSVEKENPCFRCHRQIMNTKYVHGPAGTYSCGYCHGSKGASKYNVPKRGAALCYECHSDMGVQLKKRKFVHGPVDAGLCEACHDSHGSDNESQLIKPINELCRSCHATVVEKMHVTRDSTGRSHPLSGKPDPLKIKSGRKMTCISCHNPHGGDVRYYFVNNPENRMAFCQMCHNK